MDVDRLGRVAPDSYVYDRDLRQFCRCKLITENRVMKTFEGYEMEERILEIFVVVGLEEEEEEQEGEGGERGSAGRLAF